jgi:tRNA-specific 2-thiouridylase
MSKKQTVVVAMSGGVDSSIAAALLKQQGYDVIGITMQIWQESTTEVKGAGCCSLGAVEDARRVANKIGIPHYVLNYREDQTYALFHFTQNQLAHTLMPLGELSSKDETRAIASELGLSVANKPDSQDICFVQGESYQEFLGEKAPDTIQPGNILDTSGKVRGRHDGIAFYTIGQRRRINVGSPIPLYVVGLDTENNNVLVGSEEELLSSRLFASDINWVSISGVSEINVAQAKIRYNMDPESCRICSHENTNDPEMVEVVFDSPVRAVTPGQAVVFYNQDVVLGGGTIESSTVPVPIDASKSQFVG